MILPDESYRVIKQAADFLPEHFTDTISPNIISSGRPKKSLDVIIGRIEHLSCMIMIYE